MTNTGVFPSYISRDATTRAWTISTTKERDTNQAQESCDAVSISDREAAKLGYPVSKPTLSSSLRIMTFVNVQIEQSQWSLVHIRPKDDERPGKTAKVASTLIFLVICGS